MAFYHGFWGIELRSSCLRGTGFYLLSYLSRLPDAHFLQRILTGSSFHFQTGVGVGNVKTV